MRDLEKTKELEKPIVNNKEGAILSKLWRNVLMSLNLTTKVEYLINRYISTAHKNDIKVQKMKTRSSLWNNVLSDEMTWKTFNDLIFNLLEVKKCKITLELTLRDDTTSRHDITVVNDKYKKADNNEKSNLNTNNDYSKINFEKVKDYDKQ